MPLASARLRVYAWRMLTSTASLGAVTLAGAIDLSPIAADAVAAALREAARHAAAMLDAYDLAAQSVQARTLRAGLGSSALAAWVRRSHRRKHLERAAVSVWVTPGVVYVRGPRGCVAVAAPYANHTATLLRLAANEARELHEQLRPFDRPLS